MSRKLAILLNSAYNEGMPLVLTPELLLEAYARGLFPMAHSANSTHVHWVCPEMRGQLSIEELHIPRRLKKTMRQVSYEIRTDTVFQEVIESCAVQRNDRPETWINDEIIKAYCTLHERGSAHSIECWHDGVLVGGLYGLKIGSAFFGESMFSKLRDASKVALVHLVARLWRGGFTLLDTQFVNDHLEQFGVYEQTHDVYLRRLTLALEKGADFSLEGVCEKEILQSYFEHRGF